MAFIFKAFTLLSDGRDPFNAVPEQLPSHYYPLLTSISPVQLWQPDLRQDVPVSSTLGTVGRGCCMPAMTGCPTSRRCRRCRHCALSGQLGCPAPGSMWPVPRLPQRLRLHTHSQMFLSTSICAAPGRRISCCPCQANQAAKRHRRLYYRRVNNRIRTVNRSTRAKGTHDLVQRPQCTYSWS